MAQLQITIEKEKQVSILGRPLKRVEDPRLATGSGMFVGDIKLTGMLHVAFVRSTYAHAKIKSINVAKAEGHPGVKLVLSGRDLLGRIKNLPTAGDDSEKKDSPRPALPTDEVNYVGEAVLAIIAENPNAARDAGELVEIDYEPMVAVEDIERALEPNSPKVHDYLPDNVAYHTTYERGEVNNVFEQADEVIECKFVNQRIAPLPLEPRGVIASYDAGSDALTIWISTQDPHGIRSAIADVLKMPDNKVRVIAPDVGGGFGAKSLAYPEEMVISYASTLLHRPLKWIESRSENLMSMTHGRGQKQKVRAAVSRDGKLLGLDVTIISDAGAYSTPGGWSNPYFTGLMAPNAYDLAAYRFEIFFVYTNKVPQDAYRGAGRPEANYLAERTMNVVARRLKLDPAKVRMLNFVKKDQFPFNTISGMAYDTGDYESNLKKALEVSKYESLRAEQREARQNDRLIGVGIATWVDITGTGPEAMQTAIVSITNSGKVIVTIGGHPHGQGHVTTAVQIASQVLGIDRHQIIVKYGDTELLPWSTVTGGSSSASGTGSAVLVSAMRIKDKMSRIAAKVQGLHDSSEFVFEDGKIFPKNFREKALSFPEVAKVAYQPQKLPEGMDPTLFEYTAFVPKGFVFPFGTHIAVVEIDKETGAVKLLKYYAVDDCGMVLNPLIVEGQVHGGILQGIGQALTEQIVYDSEGQLLTSTLADYLIPSADQTPRIVVDRTETPTSYNPLGVKGIGEGPTLAATPAVVNAVEDALSDYDVMIETMPLTPEFLSGIIRASHLNSI